MEPELTDRIIGGGLLPGWAQMDDPKKLCLSLADWLKGQGVAFEVASVDGVSAREDGADIRFADGTSRSCDKLVIACGAWSKKLTAQLGDAVPLDTERGYNITVPDPGIKVTRFIMLPWSRFRPVAAGDGGCGSAGLWNSAVWNCRKTGSGSMP